VTAPTIDAIADHLDAFLRIGEIPDYPNALNGIQVANRRPITRIAAAVDVSRTVIEQAIESRANMLIVHHGMFWAGLQRIRGVLYDRLKLMLDNDISLYAAHLPLDAHPTVGNNTLLAKTLGLDPLRGFAEFRGFMIGVQGVSAIPTATLLQRATAYARQYGGEVRATPVEDGRETRRWAICTGAGASASTLAEAVAEGIDTMIVGEGPHWTAVDAPDVGLSIIYAGHYATETLGVRALAERVGDVFSLPWSFIDSPTGL
jgi:dinuclear metal center YbgI/SA1388 family protein